MANTPRRRIEETRDPLEPLRDVTSAVNPHELAPPRWIVERHGIRKASATWEDQGAPRLDH